MTATTTTRNPATPGPAAPKLVWVNDDGVTLNSGKPMTGHAAAQYVRRSWDQYGARIQRPGVLETWMLCQAGPVRVSTWTGTLPVPDDLHAAVRDLILDLPLSVVQGDLLTKALSAAADSTDPTPHLLQLLATTAVTR